MYNFYFKLHISGVFLKIVAKKTKIINNKNIYWFTIKDSGSADQKRK